MDNKNMVRSLVMIGHVDHGKSTLLGHLLLKTGYIDQRKFEIMEKDAQKEKMEKWKYARILDIFEEERRTGKTKEFNMIETDINGNQCRVIDTPGHKLFIESMISGISQNVKNACIVISARKGEYSDAMKGCLDEQMILAKSIGIDNVVVLINKCDKAKREDIDAIRKKMETKVRKLGWGNNFEILEISGWTGQGLDEWMNWIKNLPIDISNDDTKNPEHNTKDLEHDALGMIGENNEWKCKFKILNCHNIITKGYQGTIHFRGQHADFEIIKMNKHIAKKGDVIKAIVCFEKKIALSDSDRLIVRNTDMTIGFGRIEM